MSVAYRTVCVDCRLEGPLLGDGGYVGYPSASDRPFDPDDDGLSTFGSIYLGLDGIGMTTLEYDVYLSFLKSHQRHSVRVLSENDVTPWQPDPNFSSADPESTQNASGYALGHFELRCYMCRRRRWTEGAEIARVRRERALSAIEVELFFDRVMFNRDIDFHASEPFGLGALELVGSFLERHREHQVRSMVTPVAEQPSTGGAA